ncbi:MAG: hypothetical protein JWP80_1789 [Pseudomonas sp.]|nr:hypothetical protein [Pseudomonas sp.]
MISKHRRRRVTARMGLFFDGTGNNRINSQIAADCRALAPMNNQAHTPACKGLDADLTSSYGNDVSNVARLYELYLRRPTAQESVLGWAMSWPIYVSGVGTTTGRKDSVLAGQSLGRGATGILAKVERGVKKLSTALEDFAENNPDCVIGQLELDLFGFSRGAAAARHFANEVLKREKGTLAPLLKQKNIPWAPGFSWENASVQVKVIGLFDTVAAMGGLKDFGNVKDAVNRRVNLYLPRDCAQQVVQLVAEDEVRGNFALNSIAPGWTKEVLLPGAHSDIGGGYHLQMREQLLLTQPRRSMVSMDTPYHTTSAWKETQADLLTIDASQWLDPLDMHASLRVECKETHPKNGSHNVGIKAVSAAVAIDRRVYGHLSRIYLRVMHELACAEGVPLAPIPDSPALKLVPELMDIERKLIAYAKGGDNTLTEGERRLLRRRYIHRSAHWNALGVEGVARSRAIYVHAPEPGGRIRHPNIAQPGYPQ